MERITCSDCGTVNNLNPEKHSCRPKWCQGCRAIIAKPIRPFTKFRYITQFLTRLPIVRQRIEKNKKIRKMRTQAIIYENDLRQQEETARRELARMLKAFPHLQEWVK